MNETAGQPGPYTLLMQATTVLLLFQAVFMLAQLFDDAPHSNSMTGMLVATIALAAVNRRLLTNSQASHAIGYVTAWRYGMLTLLGVLSVVIAVRAYAPQATPDGIPTLFAMLVSAVIALKGALFGKLKPGGVLGLRVPWTCQSRLAWEQTHRLMGRILFFGGLAGLVSAPFLPFGASLAVIGGVIFVGLTAGLIKSWRVWRNDPERTGARCPPH
jgi:uncharacterized membrane protein